METAADANRAREEFEQRYLAHSSIDPDTLESLRSLADEIQDVLVPVEPTVRFREWLQDRLSDVVRRRLAWRIVEPSDRSRWIFILGMAVGSLIPIVGLAMAYLLRARRIDKPQHAPSH